MQVRLKPVGEQVIVLTDGTSTSTAKVSSRRSRCSFP